MSRKEQNSAKYYKFTNIEFSKKLLDERGGDVNSYANCSYFLAFYFKFVCVCARACERERESVCVSCNSDNETTRLLVVNVGDNSIPTSPPSHSKNNNNKNNEYEYI